MNIMASSTTKCKNKAITRFIIIIIGIAGHKSVNPLITKLIFLLTR